MPLPTLPSAIDLSPFCSETHLHNLHRYVLPLLPRSFSLSCSTRAAASTASATAAAPGTPLPSFHEEAPVSLSLSIVPPVPTIISNSARRTCTFATVRAGVPALPLFFSDCDIIS